MPGHRQGVQDRSQRVELDADRHVAEGEIEIHDAHAADTLHGQGNTEIDRQRGLAAAALGAEHGDDLTRRRFLICRRSDHPPRHLVGPAAGGGHRRVIPDLNDVAHAGLQRAHQQGDVHFPAGQDHPDRRPRQSERGGERQGVAGHGPRADDHQDLVRVTVEQLGGGGEGIRSAHFPVDAGQQLSGAGRRLAQYGHGSLLDSGLQLGWSSGPGPNVMSALGRARPCRACRLPRSG